MQQQKQRAAARAERREWKITETDPVRPPTCVKCIDEGGLMSPHTAEFEVRDRAGILITFACSRSLVRVFSRVVTVAIALLAFACSSSSGSSDAGDVDGPRFDGGRIVDLLDGYAGGEPDAGDAGELEPDAEDLEDAGELEPDAEDLEDAGEPDAGDVDAGELQACATDGERRLCRAPACEALCVTGTNLSCCDGTAGELERCACEVSP